MSGDRHWRLPPKSQGLLLSTLCALGPSEDTEEEFCLDEVNHMIVFPLPVLSLGTSG